MICIIGAGISGLTTGYFLQKAGLEYCILEGSKKPGGYIKTYKDDKYILEQGPNSLLIDETLLDFIKEVGLESQLEYADPVNKNRFIYKNGRYQPLPANPLSLVTSNFFSWNTKTRIIKELLTSPKKSPNKLAEQQISLHDFFVAKFGEEVADYALQPFVSGIYSGDPKKLLTHLTFPALLKYQNEYGSVIKGLVKNAGARKKSVTFIEGMESLPKSIAKNLNVRYETRVQNILQEEGKYLIMTNKGNLSAEKIVITTTTDSAASYLRGMLPATSIALSAVNYPPMFAVHTAYKKDEVAKELQGFGGLNPCKEKLFASGTIFSSTIFKGRCPDNETLFTTFIGGSLFKNVVLLTDYEIMQRVHQELASNFSIKGLPVMQKISKWEKAIPQYDVNLNYLIKNVESLDQEGLFICANWYNGVSLGDCIKKGIETAKNIHLQILK